MIQSNLVCSHEYAQKLKDIGINSLSNFAYFKVPLYGEWWKVHIQTKSLIGLPAYTAQELWDLSKDCHFNLWQEENETCLYYQPETGTDNSYRFYGNNIADLMAQMLIARDREYREDKQNE